MPPSRVVIIGAGFAGLGLGIRLRLAGYDDFVILEQADRLGGVWRDNSYPGAACDIPSHLYSFSFERHYPWRRAHATRDEIVAYLHHCVDKYGLSPHIQTGKAVTQARFDEGTLAWEVTCSDGSRWRGEVLVIGAGKLGHPSIPELPGLETFEGVSFHSARWDHTYSFEGKRIAVVGTGASAIQFAPELAKRADALTIFQRSAPWVASKHDHDFSDRRRWLYRALPLLRTLERAWIYAKHETYQPGLRLPNRMLRKLRATVGAQMDRHIADPQLRAQVTPDHAFGCKRILFSNDWYAMLTRPNVVLVTSPIARVERDAVLTEDGARHPLDGIVFGTGFDTDNFLGRLEVFGRSGRALSRAWQDGAEAYLGLTVSGFPNLFFLYGPNTNVGHTSILYMLESQFNYVLSALRALSRIRGAADRPPGAPAVALDVRPERQARFNEELQRKLVDMVWQSGCRSWYVTAGGKNTHNWPDPSYRYRARTRRIDLDDFELVRASAPPAP